MRHSNQTGGIDADGVFTFKSRRRNAACGWRKVAYGRGVERSALFLHGIVYVSPNTLLLTLSPCSGYLNQLTQLHPRVERKFTECCRKANLDKISDPAYKKLKPRFLIIRELMESQSDALDDDKRTELVRLILSNEELLPAFSSMAQSGRSGGILGALFQLLSFQDSRSLSARQFRDGLRAAEQEPDSQFIAALIEIQRTEPIFHGVVSRLQHSFQEEIKRKMTSALSKIQIEILSIQTSDATNYSVKEANQNLDRLKEESFRRFVRELGDALSPSRYRFVFIYHLNLSI